MERVALIAGVWVFYMVQKRIALISSVPELDFWFSRWWSNPIPDVEIVSVVFNKGVLRSRDYPVHVIHHENFSSREGFENALLEQWMPSRVDDVIAWEFDSLFSPHMLEVFPHRVLNIHPSLLPQFKGSPEKVYQEILRAKPIESGVTLHEIDEGIDTGKIIAQKKFGLEPNESLYSLKEKTRKAGMELLIEYYLKK